MAIYAFERTQLIPADIDTLWDFFSSPANLATITPPEMKFKQTSGYTGDKIYAGQLIRYRVIPMAGIPVRWLTEITHVVDKQFFVDEQRMGPFSFWQHQHHFAAVEGGTKMTDIIHYKVPGWFIGSLMNKLVIQKRLNQIFEFRRQKTTEIWGAWPGTGAVE